MTLDGEAAADVLTGAVVAKAVEPESGGAPSASVVPQSLCLNCGAGLTDAYCASCGQSAHIHRNFRSLGHDVLHSVFHFEGKFWRTMPELVFRPGRLTRRYIDGERAKFISPMALFLFTVFVMYGVFAFTSELDWENPPPLPPMPGPPDIFGAEGLEEAAQPALGATMDAIEESIEDLRGKLDDADLSDSDRSALEIELRNLELSRAFIQPAATGDSERDEGLTVEARASDASEAEQPTADEATGSEPTNLFARAIQKLEENPDLVFYKMKSNGYKWSWLLVPLSIPFMWMLFLSRREFPLYDHAVFLTYSISFMMMLLIMSTLAQIAGAGGSVQAALLMLIPPLHLYKQLRGAYGLSRAGALVRLFFLLASAVIVLSIFATMLLLMGALE